MNWKFFAFSLLFWIAFGVLLVFAFQRWPQVARSPWVIGGLTLIAIAASRATRRLWRK